MYIFLLILHLFICMALVGVVLIQSGKGGGLAGGAFGGSAQTVFGGRGATDFITRATMILGGAFFVTSLTLAYLSLGLGRKPRSVFQTENGRTTTGAPAAPGSAPRSNPAPTGTAPSTTPGKAPAPANPSPKPPGKTGP